jgi:HAMP domain-containing protein
MRSRMRTIIARLREREKLYEELNLNELDRQMTATCNSILAADEAIGELEQSPNVIAAELLASLGNDCDLTSCSAGSSYCGTMAMALVALRGLLPGLSGLIREHAAFMVNNPTLPLPAMPFAPV